MQQQLQIQRLAKIYIRKGNGAQPFLSKELITTLRNNQRNTYICKENIMKKIHFLSLAMTLLTVNIAFAADEIHWTVTGQNSVTFDWRGTSAENSIGYGLTSGNYTQVTATTPNPVPVSSSGPFWEAKLTGLTANTRYYYKIGTGPERSFRTAAGSGQFRF